MAALTREQQIANLRRAQAEQAQYQQEYEGAYAVPPVRSQQTIEEATEADIYNYPGLFPFAKKTPKQTAFDPTAPWAPKGGARNTSPMPLDYATAMGGGQPTINQFGQAFSGFQEGVTGRPAWMNQPLDLGTQAQSPLDAANARNRAQQGEVDSKRLQNAYKSVVESQQGAANMGFGTIGKDGKYTQNQGGAQDLEAAGFKRETGRRYSAERDTAGNIIAMHALQGSNEKGVPEDITREELEKKSWSGNRSDGSPGHPFTPNLDKFKAKQDANWLAQTTVGQNPSDVAQMRYAQQKAAVAAANPDPAVTQQKQALDEKLRAMNINPKTMEQYPEGGGYHPENQLTSKTGMLDTSGDAQQAWEQGKQTANAWEQQGASLFNQADQLKQERINRISSKSPMSTLADYKNALAEQSARDAGAKAINQYGKSLQQAAKNKTDLESVPKTQVTEVSGPAGTGYSSTDSASKKVIEEAKRKKIFEGGTA
jgi:hypothetical protein